MPSQNAWHFCQNCFDMFFDGSENNKGLCPATNAGHVSQGFEFELPFDVDPSTGQRDWRFCSKCFAMFFDGAPDKGRCPAGGGHVAQGFAFVLPHDRPEQPGEQKDWRFCQQCFALFFAGSANRGRCPAGGLHSAQGFNFVLPHTGFTVTNFESGPVTTGMPLGGSATIRVFKDGRYTFHSDVHDSGFDNVDYAVTAVLATPSGEVFFIQHQGSVEGTTGGLPPNRNDHFTQEGADPRIADSWNEISGAVFKVSLAGKDTLVEGLEGMLKDLVKQALAALANAAAKEVVQLVAA